MRLLKNWIIGLVIYFSGAITGYHVFKASDLRQHKYNNEKYKLNQCYTVHDRNSNMVGAGLSWLGIVGWVLVWMDDPYERDKCAE
jgi:hypothetical protein